MFGGEAAAGKHKGETEVVPLARQQLGPHSPPWGQAGTPSGQGPFIAGGLGTGPALLQGSPVKGIYWSQCSWQQSGANIRAASSSSMGSHVGLMPCRTRGQGWEEQRRGLGLGVGVTVTTGEAPGFTVAPRGAGGDALPLTRSPKPLGWGRGRERGRGSRSAMPNPMAQPG